MSLFENPPLAYRMRPRNIDEIIGQSHLLSEGKLLQRMIRSGKMKSIILYGPPGVGKTSIASALASSVEIHFESLNAVSSGKKDMEAVVKKAESYGKVMLLIDEIHRFSKSQQDFLLPFTESGLIVLIGATTENPYFEVNRAIVSRCEILELERLTKDEVLLGLERALEDGERGLASYKPVVESDALEHIVQSCQGDMRTALNSLEIAVTSTDEDVNGFRHITLEIAEECLQKKMLGHDKDGDSHYDLLSAFQKSIRGSDVNAAIYYLARLMLSGDIESVLRRLVVIAYEDIGLANMQACTDTVLAVQAFERLGMKEGRIPLADAVIQLCLSPKSNSAYKALDMAMHDIQNNGASYDIPLHLKDAHWKDASKLGRGVDYKYPHDYPRKRFGGWVNQPYLPDELQGKSYYTPVMAGNEIQLGNDYRIMYEAQNKKKLEIEK